MYVTDFFKAFLCFYLFCWYCLCLFGCIVLSGRVVRAHIFVSGVVQGVGFRYSAYLVASRLGLVGFVRNLMDGRVEIVVEGPEGKVREFIKWCYRGPPAAVVERVDVSWENPTGEFSRFDIAF